MKRGSGILLHITSLPSGFGIGDFGPEARRFVDFLAQAKQSYWQILPLSVSLEISPYNSSSAFAGNTLLISPEQLVSDGLLKRNETDTAPRFPVSKVDYSSVISLKEKLFRQAFVRFKNKGYQDEYKQFCDESSSWLEDFTLFMALKKHFQGKAWPDWPKELRDRRQAALRSIRKDLQDRIEYEKFLQFVFWKQWMSLKCHCHEAGVEIIGDMPIYMDFDSEDCWTHPEIFKLGKNMRPSAVAGVPPDYFSKTGQRWGNPVYRWEVLKKRRYDWWVQRLEHNFILYDSVRIDHFRGFVAFWEVPAREKTAIKGKWVKAPAMDFFRKLRKKFTILPIIAEDLGFITPDVKRVMKAFALPGMKVLQFAFGDDDPEHPYLPHTYHNNCVVYTGTHDNNTVKGWFMNEATSIQKRRVWHYLGQKVTDRDVHWEFIRLAMMSAADIAMIPMQDVLGLGEKARMNRPATRKGNWRWRVNSEHLTADLSRRLAEITQISGRA